MHILLAGNKYITSLSDEGYSRKMRLTIRRVAARDFSSYRCVAKNSLGETDGLIRLDGKFHNRGTKSLLKNLSKQSLTQ